MVFIYKDNKMFNKKKKSVKMSIEDYESYRDKLLEWNWLTEALDAKKNKFTYQPTELGVAVYSAIVNLVGRDKLVNGYKLDVKRMEGIIIASSNVKQDTKDALLEANIITQTYNVSTDITNYELTPTGSKLFVAFFVSYNREVGTLPGDAKAKFFEIMQNMPRYVNTASALINQLGNAFQSFDKNSNYRGGEQQVGDFNRYTPNYSQTQHKKTYTGAQKRAYAKQKAKWKKEKTKKSKYKKTTNSKNQAKKERDPFSKMGDDMLKGMKF